MAVPSARPAAERPCECEQVHRDEGTAIGTVEQEQVATQELALPASVQEALGELVNAAKAGLLALSVGVGLGVLSEMLEAEVDKVVGPKGKRSADRTCDELLGTAVP